MNDYLFAKHGVSACDEIGNYNGVVSMCAQAGEKFLKAIREIAFSDDDETIQLLHTHNLRTLHNKISSRYKLSADSKECKWLGDFYMDASYPGDNFVVATKEDAEECLRITELLMNDSKRILDGERIRRKEERDKLDDLNAFR